MADSDNDERGFEDEEEDDQDEEDVDLVDELNEEGKEEDGNELGGIRRGAKGKVADEERITSRFMTKYERARILGSRAL